MLKFLGVGAQKCGTTWLYHALSLHPQVQFPGCKEVHFWDRTPRGDLTAYQRLFSHPVKFEGDITPAYGFLPLSVIREVYEQFGADLKLIYMIRNPLDRAWSAARMAVRRAEMEVSEASDYWFIDHFKSYGSLQRGDFEQCIRNWRCIFGEASLLIVRYEELCANPLALAKRCADHIGIDPGWYSETHLDTLQASQFAGDGTPLRQTLFHPLLDIYHDKIISLGSYLDLDLSDWINPYLG
jgi:hypothetical protein